jgi:branched-chain amino acid transport system substrate-binding protein
MLGVRTVLRSRAWVLLGILFIFFSLTAMGGNSEAADKGPIRVGFISPQTGNFAQMGLDMGIGFKMFLDEIKNTVAGRKIELIIEDEGTSASASIAKARKLITHDKVNLIAGVFFTPSAYAISPICEEAGIPLLITVSAGDDITQRKSSRYVTRVAFTGCEMGHVAGDYAYHKLGWRKAVIFGFDYAWGYENGGGFQRVFEESGGKVIQKVWAPLNTTDFGPYVTQLKQDADGVWDVITGAASIRCIKALRSSGLLEKWKVLIPGTGTDETLLPPLGDDALGVMSVLPYSAVLQTAENMKFNDNVRKALKKDPALGIAFSYTGADWMVRAIKAVDGDIENKDKFLQALRAVEIPNSLRGPLKMDKYGHVIQNMYVRRVDKVGNGYQNTVIETYPMASQFFKFDPETYLKSPVYTRDYPPCKFCE